MNQKTDQLSSAINSAEQQHLDDDLCVHVFSVSANMLAVCLAVIGIFRITKHLQGSALLGETVLLFAAFAFVAASLTSYVALRTRRRRRRYNVERIADGMFLCGMLLIATVCVLISVELF